MKKLYSLLFFALLMSSAFAQQLNLQSRVYFARLTANPALTAYNGSTNVYGFFRDQWSGALSHPRMYGGVGELSLWGDRIGTGIEVTAYTGGVTQLIDAKLYYAQKIKLAEDHRLSLGVSGGMLQRGFRISTTDREMVNNDPSVNTPNATMFDMSIGLAYQWKKLTVGFAIPNLLDANKRIYGNRVNITDFKRNYLINGSYEVSIAQEKFNIEPGFLLKINELKKVALNLQVMANYKRTVFLGVGYDLFGGMPITAGARISKIFTVAYTYQVPILQDVPFTPSIYSSHELTVGVCFDKWMKKADKVKDWDMAKANQTEYDSLVNRLAALDTVKAQQQTVDSLAQKVDALQQALDNAQQQAAGAAAQKAEQQAEQEAQKKEQEAKLKALNKQIEERAQQQEEEAAQAKADEEAKPQAEQAQQQKARPVAPQQTATAVKNQPLAPEAKSFNEETETKTTPKAGDRFNLDNVSFGSNGSELDAASYAQLDKLVAYLQSHKNIRVRITGHTDSRASEEYNGWLSRLRARAVADYLKSKGISPNRIEALGMGPRMPVADNQTDEGRAKNRRVEVEIVK